MTEGKKGYFDALYSESTDPYAVRTRWYEERKRSVLMASLPQRRYTNAFEPGCGAAELTLQLAERCDSLLASDFSEAAVASARERTQALPNVSIEQQVLPVDWPHAQGPFDLIVVSEIAYFLDERAIRMLARFCAESLAVDGTLVACDWRPDFAERAATTDAVHAALAELGLPRLVRHDESDFLLQVWSRDARSVAQQEGIR
ncbi:class I SAM-dependent methyltransferase [Variovorax sp. PAMC 28711]|uniref:class I SAM-dependent methyltransferase n=1 Tax=Variovorax sp. PAMC 28711 TaxID=1795631 RepID=UPI00078C95E5|nr:SAM-dependent methyltransferase [Variovorax sp. PAMC 28711]AMM23287.1 methyltransferase [Variovorax sp. PAMC 28711]